MAEIRTSMVLEDGITQTIQTMVQAMERLRKTAMSIQDLDIMNAGARASATAAQAAQAQAAQATAQATAEQAQAAYAAYAAQMGVAAAIFQGAQAAQVMRSGVQQVAIALAPARAEAIAIAPQLAIASHSTLGFRQAMQGAVGEISAAEVKTGFLQGAFEGARAAAAALADKIKTIHPFTTLNEKAQAMYNAKIKDGQKASGGLLSKVKAMVGAYMGLRGAMMLANMADQQAQTDARLGMITSSAQELNAVQQQIYASSQATRSSYADTANMVAKLRMQASDAFRNNDETIMFAEQLQKRFKIAGADATAVESTMYNLTQALSSGVLRGQDLNVVLQNAPSIVQDTAKYLGKSNSEIRKMAANGELTADVLKNAILANSEKINKQFKKMPMTFQEAKTQAINMVQQGLRPALATLTRALSNPDVMNGVYAMARGFGVVLQAVVMLLSGVLWTFGKISTFISQNADIVIPILGAIAAAVVLLALVHLKLAIAQAAAAVQQWALNAAFYACPLTWIALGLVAIIAIIALVVAAINRWKGTHISAVGVMVGAVYAGAYAIGWAWQTCANKVVAYGTWMQNRFADVQEAIVNGWRGMCHNMAEYLASFVSWAAGKLMGLASFADSIAGTNMAGGLSSAVQGVNDWADGVGATKFTVHRVPYKPLYQPQSFTDSVKAGWEKGYGIGEGFQNKAKEFGGNMQDLVNQANAKYDALKNPQNEGAMGGMPKNMKGAAGSLKNIADNTADIAEQLKRTGGVDGYLRELAVQRGISAFSVEKVEVKMENTFGDVNDKMDLDGYMNKAIDDLKHSVATGIGGLVPNV